ncbi:hypothetical protein I603_1249 [Erythrobacter dokdonensis DSW-74]|uniref:Uncharacterized protein n=1 Tax=Erythrobacter dokdonensis DSW-74 TaxID=1300349 RepID=A0A1A7BJB5_9SPHN|nr:hypothetical protein I603_1249 [Erythrobacter dokdonensis DSW-74]
MAPLFRPLLPRQGQGIARQCKRQSGTTRLLAGSEDLRMQGLLRQPRTPSRVGLTHARDTRKRRADQG